MDRSIGRRGLTTWQQFLCSVLVMVVLISMLPIQAPFAASPQHESVAVPERRPHTSTSATTDNSPQPASLPIAATAIDPPSPEAAAHNCIPSAAGWTRFAGSGVNVVCGNFIAQSVDLRVTGRGIPFAFVRTYNSANPTDGPLGFGWTHSYGLSLTRENTSDVLIRTADGRLDRYTLSGGSYSPPPGVFSTLTANGDGSFTLKDPDQTRYRFDQNGYLTSITDRNANTLTLGYVNSRLTTLTDTVGRSFSFTYDANGHVIQLADSLTPPRTVSFGYNAAGDLIATTDTRGKTTSFTYDSAHRLLTVTDARPLLVLTNTYDASSRVTQQQDAKQNAVTFATVSRDG